MRSRPEAVPEEVREVLSRMTKSRMMEVLWHMSVLANSSRLTEEEVVMQVSRVDREIAERTRTERTPGFTKMLARWNREQARQRQLDLVKAIEEAPPSA